MNETKEKILLTALHLFAQSGYEAVSVSQIAGELDMTKGALYKHYTNKQDIFDSIVLRMEELDAQRARQYELPEGTFDNMADAYRQASVKQVVDFSRAQFKYWTEEDFPASFRRMLTLEQFRNKKMQKLYQQYLSTGPLNYITDIFFALKVKDARKKAIELYAPMFLFYSIYDAADIKSLAAEALEHHLLQFSAE